MKKVIIKAVVVSIGILGFLGEGNTTNQTSTSVENAEPGSFKDEAQKLVTATQQAISDAHQKAVDKASEMKAKIEMGTKQVVQGVEEKAMSWFEKMKEWIKNFWNKLTGKKS
jgi:ElaB/YqjD/DUF883 family membrane-anchored ribosome-binding protein